MSTNDELNARARLRAQYDSVPYPDLSADHPPQCDPATLWLHDLTTPVYLRDRQVVSKAGKVILDAGCGSGYTSLTLALANPEARIVGVDLSEVSIRRARERFAHYGLEDRGEFHAMALEDLPRLGMAFDAINCDEVLYLLPDPPAGLGAMAAVLKPDGILRANLHNVFARGPMLRAQQAFQMLGLFDDRPGPEEAAAVYETMSALDEAVYLRSHTWVSPPALQKRTEYLLVNHLLIGDRGFSVPQMFRLLAGAGLEFLSTTNWTAWELATLFEDPAHLPALIAEAHASAPPMVRMHLFELIDNRHRLIDFWCGHAGRARPHVPFRQWTPAMRERAHIRLHPQLASPGLRAYLEECIATGEPFVLNHLLHAPPLDGPIRFPAPVARCLLPLWEGPQPLAAFLGQWLSAAPTLTDPEAVAALTAEVLAAIARCEDLTYFMITLD